MNRKHLQHRVFFVTPEEGEGGGKPVEEQEVAAGSTEEGGKGDDKPDEDKGEENDDLDPKARALVTRANSEAAKYRTQLREAQEALGKAKSNEEFETVVKDLNAKIAKLEDDNARARAIAKYELPSELASELDDVPAGSVEKIAKALAKYAAADGGNRGVKGGLNPNEGPDDFDPVAAARKARRRR